MVAVRIIDRRELERRLSPYKCKCHQAFPSGLEIWETGWGEPFTIWAEDGRYDEWQYFELLGNVIGRTMPEDWTDR